MNTISEVVESYKTFLQVKYPTQYTTYCNRLTSNPEGARGEAIIFSLLRTSLLRFSLFNNEVMIAEDTTTGGADFLVTSGQSKFITEVSCLQAGSVASQSGIKNEVKDGSCVWFGLITHKLRTKVSNKAPQVARYKMPRVIAITCEHICSDLLLGPDGAESLLSSETKIAVPIGDQRHDNTALVTDLRDSVFFRFKNGAVEPCRQSVSAVLLVSIFDDKSLIVGVLHPDPKYPFPISLLPTVPFLRLNKWPPENNVIEKEWVIHTPEVAEFYHRNVV
jgi:hypothetical protein